MNYNQRMNKVFHFIDENLNADLSLEKIAGVAFFSPFHFHRIFKAITGEQLNQYIIRRRIEKAASDLIHKENMRVGEIALQNGFSSDSSFTRAFRKFYQCSPTAFRLQNVEKIGRIGQRESKNGQENPDIEKYLCAITNLKEWIAMKGKIEIREIEAMNIAYISCIGDSQLPGTFEKLVGWVDVKSLMNQHTKMLTIYHDSFKITEEEKVRMSAGIVLHQAVEKDDTVCLTSLEGGKCIVGSFELNVEDFEKTWTGMYIWMNEHGYKRAERNPFEIYHNNFNEHPEKKCIVDFHIPIE